MSADSAYAYLLSSGWLDIRSSDRYESWHDTEFPLVPSLSPSWKMFLFGDSSPTRVLSLLSGVRMGVDLLGMDVLSSTDDLGVPWSSAHALLPAPRVRRRVWLECRGERIGYACSWWSKHVADRFFDSSPGVAIGETVASSRCEIRRELLSVSRAVGHKLLEEGLGIRSTCSDSNTLGESWGPNELWGRWYVMWREGQVLCLVHEVFSPALCKLLGPCWVRGGGKGGAIPLHSEGPSLVS